MPTTSMKMRFSIMKDEIASSIYSAYLQVLIPLVLGEGQILSQLKGAYIQAYSAGCTGTIFNILFQRAISVGKKVRTNTGIANTPVSVSYTAVNLAETAR